MRRSTFNAIQRGATWLVLGLAAVVLGGVLGQLVERWRAGPGPTAAPPIPAEAAANQPTIPGVEATHWLNSASLTRHNRRCRYFGKTKQGRPCRPDEGTACKLCGG